jgi:hypothetical protein
MRINDVNLLQQVVNYLNNHRESLRIKKMLYCLCTNRWEKDTDYLNSIDPRYLIEQIVREHDTLEKLKALLQKLIGTVNKPKQYIDIAKIIYLAIGQLYPEFHQEHATKAAAPRPVPVPTPEPTQANTSVDVPSSLQRAYAPAPTQAYTSQDVPSTLQRAYAPEPTQANTSMDVPSSLQRAYAPVPTQAHTSMDVPSSLQRAYAPVPTQQFEPETPIDDSVDESAYETYCAPEAPDEIPLDRVEVPDYDPYVLRQNVMSYTNPLRAKIILLVMLRPHFNFGSQSAATMREYYLDDLLLEVMKTYPTIEDLEESITYAVEQLIEVEEYGKAATGLLQSLVPLYMLKNQGSAAMAA